jgi:hypothetical protein
MKGGTGAAVINVASISGWSPQLAMSGQYGAAKAALIFDTERWALEFVPHRVRVNTVSPGSILVEGNGWDRYRLANPAHFEDYVRHGFPMDRLGTAQEVADVIVFLAHAGLLAQWPQHSGGRSGAAARRARSPAVPGLGAGIFETGTYPAANECQFQAAPVEWPRSAAAPADSNQEKFGGKAMTEKTVRCRSVLRRTMLVGTAGVWGGAVLRATPVQSQPAPHRRWPYRAALRPDHATAIRHGGRSGKRKSWSRRSRSSIRTIIYGTAKSTATARPAARRHRQRRFVRSPLLWCGFRGIA